MKLNVLIALVFSKGIVLSLAFRPLFYNANHEISIFRFSNHISSLSIQKKNCINSIFPKITCFSSKKQQRTSFQHLVRAYQAIFCLLATNTLAESTSRSGSNWKNNCTKVGFEKSASTKRAAFVGATDPPPCFYKNPTTRNRWMKRIELEQLSIGHELRGIIVQQLLNGTTGPKLFVDCGVGRYRHGKWKIQTAMIRLNRMKRTALEKKVKRLLQRNGTEASLTVYVSRIFPSSDRLEVVLDKSDLEDPSESSDSQSTFSSPSLLLRKSKSMVRNRMTMFPTSLLQVGQEVNGTVVRLCDYGAFVDVNGNRCGLLHIQRVADLYGQYIPKLEGLQTFGLKIGAQISVQVRSNKSKKLSLDFTNDFKQSINTSGGTVNKHSQQSHILEHSRTPTKGLMDTQTSAIQKLNNADNPFPVSAAKISVISTSVEATNSRHKNGTSIAINNYKEDEAAWALRNPREYQRSDQFQDNIENDTEYNNDDDENDYDSYDEERDIEDQLGLGSY